MNIQTTEKSKAAGISERHRPSRPGPKWVEKSSSVGRQLGWAAWVLAICIHFALCYDAIPDYLNLGVYAGGLASKPYQLRVLPMYVFRLFAHNHVLMKIAVHAPVQFRDPLQVVQIGLVLVSMLVAVFAMSGVLTRLTDDVVFSRWFSLVLLYMAYFNLAPGWGLVYSFPYDVPSLMFFCLGVYFVLSEKTWAYYVIFPFAVMNRETTCYLTLFFLIWKWWAARDASGDVIRRKKLVLLLHVLTQALVWVAIRIMLAKRFATNATDGAGGTISRTLFGEKLLFNLHELGKPQQWPVLASCFGFLLPALWLQRRWIREPGIYWSCAIIVPLWVLGMLLFGVITEIRVFSELSALLVPALALIVHNRLRPVAETSA